VALQLLSVFKQGHVIDGRRRPLLPGVSVTRTHRRRLGLLYLLLYRLLQAQNNNIYNSFSPFCSSPWTTELGKYCAYLLSVFSSRLLGYPCRCVARATLLALSYFLYLSIQVCARRAAAFVAEGWNEGSKATTIRDRRIRGAPKIQNKSRFSNLNQAKPVHTKRKDERREKKRRLKCSSYFFLSFFFVLFFTKLKC